MKYLRKLVGLIIGIAFVAALIICLGRIFAVKNINVNLVTYEDDSSVSYQKAKDALGKYKGESILFLSESEIGETVAKSNANYVVISCEKKYPCTINVVLKERLELFAVSVGGLYSMYDSDGVFLRSDFDNLNDIDATPNVEVMGIATEQMASIAVIAEEFKVNFGGLRSIVKSIELDSRPEISGYIDKLIFNLRCGLVIQIDDYSQEYGDKIKSAYNKFRTLSDKQKLSGKIRSHRVGGETGFINSDYSSL